MRLLLLYPSIPIHDEDTWSGIEGWTAGTVHEALTPV
jgi:hypothetical protein